MKQMKTLAKLVVLAAIVAPAPIVHAQAVPTATQALQISAFGGATGTYTEFEGGKNGSITAGADLTFLTVPHVKPSFEIRGTYPVDGGKITSQKNFLLGPKVEYRWGRIHPYVDFLIGRGEIDYLSGGFIYNDLRYISSPTTVYSTGLGVDFNLSPRWALKGDFQYQHWNTPIYIYNPIHPKATTFAVVYHFDFSPRHHFDKK